VGAVAPDLCGSGGFRLQPPTPHVAQGVANHHRADAAFHALPWFQRTTHRIANELELAGVRRGPARAAAHVGCELLIDGHLLADPAITLALHQTWTILERCGPEVVHLVAPMQRPSWKRWLESFLHGVEPDRYAEASYVAQRIDLLTKRRPRLATSPSEVVSIAAVLAAHTRTIALDAQTVVAEVAEISNT
jgi:hypothetical protein